MFTVAELSHLLRASEAEIQSLLDDRSLKSLRRHDVEKFLDKLAAFFTNVEKQYKQVLRQWNGYLFVHSIREFAPREIAYDAAIDALMRCRRRWLVMSPVRPVAYLKRAVHQAMRIELAKHWASDPMDNEAFPQKYEDKRLRPADSPFDYCATDRERDVMTGVLDGLTYREIEDRFGINDSTACRAHEAIRERYMRYLIA